MRIQTGKYQRCCIVLLLKETYTQERLRRINGSISPVKKAKCYIYSNFLNDYSSTPSHNTTFSHTLYETDPIIVYSTPFTSAANFCKSSAGALFYSPLDPLPNTTSPLAGGSFFNAGYEVGLNGPGNFSLLGMHCSPSYTKWVFVK